MTCFLVIKFGIDDKLKETRIEEEFLIMNLNIVIKILVKVFFFLYNIIRK